MGKLADSATAAAGAVSALQAKAADFEASVTAQLVDIQSRAIAVSARIDAFNNAYGPVSGVPSPVSGIAKMVTLEPAIPGGMSSQVAVLEPVGV